MAVFEKAQSATPQQEVCVPGSELWHVGEMQGIQQKLEERKRLCFFHILYIENLIFGSKTSAAYMKIEIGYFTKSLSASFTL